MIGNFCDCDRNGDLDLYLVAYLDRKPDKSVDPVVIVDGKKQIRADMRDQFAIAAMASSKQVRKTFCIKTMESIIFLAVQRPWTSPICLP